MTELEMELDCFNRHIKRCLLRLNDLLVERAFRFKSVQLPLLLIESPLINGHSFKLELNVCPTNVFFSGGVLSNLNKNKQHAWLGIAFVDDMGFKAKLGAKWECFEKNASISLGAYEFTKIPPCYITRTPLFGMMLDRQHAKNVILIRSTLNIFGKG